MNETNRPQLEVQTRLAEPISSLIQQLSQASPITERLHATNEPPSPTDIQILRPIVTQLEAALLFIDKKISQLDSGRSKTPKNHSYGTPSPELVRLHATRAGFEAALRSYQGILSAIRCLPREIISKIVLYALAKHRFDPRLQAVVLHSQYGVWVYSQVCRLWRQQVLSLPAVWANIDFFTVDRTDPGRHSPAILSDVLARSGREDLSISLEFREPFDADRDGPILSLLVAQSERWKSLSVVFASTDFVNHLEPIRNHLPRLEQLQMVYPRQDLLAHDDIDAFTSLFSSCPVLRRVESQREDMPELQSASEDSDDELEVDAYDLISTGELPWAQITHYRQGHSLVLVDLLEQMPNLVYLETESILNFGGTGCIHHAHLRIAKLAGTDIHDVGSLDMPQLFEVNVWGNEGYSSLIRWAPDSIQSLSFDFHPRNEAPGLKERSARITTLDFTRYGVSALSPDFLRLLTQERKIFPRLQHLLIHASYLNEDDFLPHILTFIRSRLSTLKEVSFYFYGDRDTWWQSHHGVADNFMRFKNLQHESDGLVVCCRCDIDPFATD